MRRKSLLSPRVSTPLKLSLERAGCSRFTRSIRRMHISRWSSIGWVFLLTSVVVAQDSAPVATVQPLPYGNLNYLSLVAIYALNAVVACIYYSRWGTSSKESALAHVFWTLSWWGLLLDYRVLELLGTGPATTIHDLVSILLFGVYFAHIRKVPLYSFGAVLVFSFLVVWTQTVQRFWNEQTLFRPLVAYGPSMILAAAAFGWLGWTFLKFFKGIASVVGSVTAGVYAFLQLLLFFSFAMGAEHQWPRSLWPIVVSVRVALALCYWQLALKSAGLTLEGAAADRLEKSLTFLAALLPFLAALYEILRR